MTTNTTFLRAVLLVIALVVLVPLVLMAVAWPTMGMWGGGHAWNDGTWTGHGGTGMWLLSWLPLLLILAVGYLVYRAAVHSTRSEDDPALEELRLAYARGDLSDEQFEQRRERLQREE